LESKVKKIGGPVVPGGQLERKRERLPLKVRKVQPQKGNKYTGLEVRGERTFRVNEESRWARTYAWEG